ncbi:MAG: cupin domain-containing protein [Sumerlaeia bacterium]
MRFDHLEAPLCQLDEGPLAGLRHRTVIDATAGAKQLALWQEEHKSGFRVPPHRHNCEEIITVLDGEILADIDGQNHTVKAGESILIPEWASHGFQVMGERPVRLLAIFGSAKPGIYREDGTPSTPPWEGGNSAHLESPADSQAN